jgi:hypothetical protein
MSNINSKIEYINYNSTINKMKPNGTSTPLHIQVNDSYELSTSTSPSQSSSLEYYQNNYKKNTIFCQKPTIFHNSMTTSTAASSLNIENDNNISDEEDNNYTNESSEDDNSNDDGSDIKNFKKMLIYGNQYGNQYYVTQQNLCDKNNSNNNGYFDEYAYKRASINLFLNQFKSLINNFIQENKNETRGESSVLNQQKTTTRFDSNNNDNKQNDYFFVDNDTVKKLQCYGNKICVSHFFLFFFKLKLRKVFDFLTISTQFSTFIPCRKI